MMTPSALSTVFIVSSACLAVSVMIATFEYLAILPAFDKRGALSWDILGTGYAPYKFAKLRHLWDIAMSLGGVRIILLLRLAFTLALLVSLVARLETFRAYALGGILLTGILVTYRCAFGLDGSDQMTNILSAGLLVAAVPSGPVWHISGFSFIAFQACLSYATAGIAKAISPVWRNGTALYKIMNTGTYGHAWLANVLKKNPLLGYLLCWTVIIFETSFSLSLLCPHKPLLVILAIGCLFHVGSAVFMGLNAFLWSFMAAYPAIYFCNHLLRTLFT
jgi:hypothetical protein